MKDTFHLKHVFFLCMYYMDVRSCRLTSSWARLSCLLFSSLIGRQLLHLQIICKQVQTCYVLSIAKKKQLQPFFCKMVNSCTLISALRGSLWVGRKFWLNIAASLEKAYTLDKFKIKYWCSFFYKRKEIWNGFKRYNLAHVNSLPA